VGGKALSGTHTGMRAMRVQGYEGGYRNDVAWLPPLPPSENLFSGGGGGGGHVTTARFCGHGNMAALRGAFGEKVDTKRQHAYNSRAGEWTC